jgi:hypothetical protein
MVDKFLAAVELKNQMVSGVPFETRRLFEALTVLAAQEDLGVEEEHSEKTELIAESELASWREILEPRNDRVETYHIRRFYDHSDSPIDIGILVSLARVFHSLPYSESNQSKYDLVVTRLFTKGSAETMRNLRIPREKIAESLAAILSFSTDEFSSAEVETAVDCFDRFTDTLKGLIVIEDFIDKDTFEELRHSKRSIGKLFFDPRVTAAAIECNITVGNVFAGLVNRVNGPLYELINNKFDFAGAFHDVSHSAKTELWDEMTGEGAEDESEDTPDRAQVREILEMIGGLNESVIEDDEQTENVAEQVSDTNKLKTSAAERVNDILAMLNSESPDYDAIRRHKGKYETLRSIDLEYLLEGGSEAVREICRDVLGVILWTEDLCANELQGKYLLSRESQSEAATLIQLSEKYQQDLQKAMENAESPEQFRLLTVSNKLLASHLDLKKFLVGFAQRSIDAL